jgi:hypothetical protein
MCHGRDRQPNGCCVPPRRAQGTTCVNGRPTRPDPRTATGSGRGLPRALRYRATEGSLQLGALFVRRITIVEAGIRKRLLMTNQEAGDRM